MSQLKPLPKLVLLVAAVAIIIVALKTGISHGWIPGAGILEAVIPQKVKLPDIRDSTLPDVQPIAYPSSSPTNCADPVRSEHWAWNSQTGLFYGNGGIDTTHNSIAEKLGACIHFTRQDDSGQMHADMLACANELKNSTECSSGVEFITIMMNGSEQWLAEFNAEAKKICPDCIAESVGSYGFSRGEDGFWGPQSWKDNPKSALGDGLTAVVVLDGDWDIPVKWAGDNRLKVNPDQTTFDPDAINFVNVPKFTDAPERYISSYCEDRRVVKNGKLTGESRNVCVKGYATWTPGDVTGAMKKGGLVRIVSTKEYNSLMPNVLIGIRKWNKSHPDKVASLLATALQGGDQIRAFPEALKRAADISAKIYNEESGSYWLKYYKGITQSDATGKSVELGGSYASGLNDVLALYGILGGSNNNAKAVYEIASRFDTEQYPEKFKKNPLPTYAQISNVSYLLQAKSLLDSGSAAPAETTNYSATDDANDIVSKADYHIEFPTGSAMLTAEGMSVVHEILSAATVTKLYVTLNGHTDNTGNPSSNRTLSEARAESVKRALQQLASTDFPDSRFRVHGYGQDRPAADNGTADGRARNRRVEVVLAQ